MTKGEAQALDELHRTPEELSARTAQMDKLARNGKQGGYLAADTLETRVQAPEPAPTRTRTTVGKLLARYQERVAEFTGLIEDAERKIAETKATIADCEQKRAFWLEAIGEIERD